MEPKISRGCKQQELGDYLTNKDKVPNAQTIQTRNLQCRYRYETWSRWHNCSRECRGRKQKQVKLEEKKEHQNVTYWGERDSPWKEHRRETREQARKGRHKIISRGDDLQTLVSNKLQTQNIQERHKNENHVAEILTSKHTWLTSGDNRLRDQAGAKLQRSSPPEKGNFFKSFSEVKYKWCVCRRKPNPKKL